LSIIYIAYEMLNEDTGPWLTILI